MRLWFKRLTTWSVNVVGSPGTFNQVLEGAGEAEAFAQALRPLLSGRASPAERELIKQTPTILQIFTELASLWPLPWHAQGHAHSSYRPAHLAQPH